VICLLCLFPSKVFWVERWSEMDVCDAWYDWATCRWIHNFCDISKCNPWFYLKHLQAIYLATFDYIVYSDDSSILDSSTSMWNNILLYSIPLLPRLKTKRKKQLVAPVRPSVCFHSIFWIDWPLNLSFFLCVEGRESHDHNSPEIKRLCHQSRSKVNA